MTVKETKGVRATKWLMERYPQPDTQIEAVFYKNPFGEGMCCDLGLRGAVNIRRSAAGSTRKEATCNVAITIAEELGWVDYAAAEAALTIKDYSGRWRELSAEEFVIAADADFEVRTSATKYKQGTRVRLIAGVDENEKPGYHFDPGWVTVCRSDALVAEFVGFDKKHIIPANAYE